MVVAEEYVADVGQELPSAVTFRSRLAVHQRKAQCHLRVGQREIVGGSLGSVQGILDLAHRWIIGLERSGRYTRAIGVGDSPGVGQRVGVARHGDTVSHVVAPSGTTEAIPANGPRRKGNSQRGAGNEVTFSRVAVGRVDDSL